MSSKQREALIAELSLFGYEPKAVFGRGGAIQRTGIMADKFLFVETRKDKTGSGKAIVSRYRQTMGQERAPREWSDIPLKNLQMLHERAMRRLTDEAAKPQ